jgi:hypothetical protein
MFPELTGAEVERICDALRRFAAAGTPAQTV